MKMLVVAVMAMFPITAAVSASEFTPFGDVIVQQKPTKVECKDGEIYDPTEKKCKKEIE